MHLDKLVKKVNNLKNINLKVNNDKNILLINMMKLNKNLSFYIQNAVKSKSLIDKVSKQYNIKNSFVQKENTKFKFLNKIKNFFIKPKELWIYLTEQQKYATDSYSRYERYILEKIKSKNADFITIGERAVNFCKEHKLNVIKECEFKKQDELAVELAQMIKILYLEQNYKKVRFVINSNKNFNSSFTILPTQNFDVFKLTNSYEQTSQNLEITKYKIFPNAEKFVDNQTNIFIENAINSLLIESSFYATKVALVTANRIIKDLDENITKLSKKLIQIKREKEIEEIVLLAGNRNVLSLDGDSNDK